MQIVLSKQAQKYLQKQTGKTRKRLDNALDNLAELNGDIKKVGDMRYRYKIEHYRFLFSNFVMIWFGCQKPQQSHKS